MSVFDRQRQIMLQGWTVPSAAIIAAIDIFISETLYMIIITIKMSGNGLVSIVANDSTLIDAHQNLIVLRNLPVPRYKTCHMHCMRYST